MGSQEVKKEKKKDIHYKKETEKNPKPKQKKEFKNKKKRDKDKERRLSTLLSQEIYIRITGLVVFHSITIHTSL
jgi:hypothetical protein